MLWIDTHCHLDAHEFGAESLDVAARARDQGVGMIVIPAIERANFSIVRDLAHGAPNACYALGIHPIYVPHATDDDLLALREAVAAALRLVRRHGDVGAILCECTNLPPHAAAISARTRSAASGAGSHARTR